MNRARGFTIVELLIVIVVIGILAAIVIVAFNGVQQNARITQQTSAVKQVTQALHAYVVQESTYPAVDASTSASNNIACFDGTDTCWTGASAVRATTLRTELAKVSNNIPTTYDNPIVLTYNTTTDTAAGGNYTGYYIVYRIAGTSCPKIGSLYLLNSNTQSTNLMNCRVRLP